MMGDWTPGPWKINKYLSVGAGRFGTEPIVAAVEPFYGPDKRHGNHSANARLIAAAPELYEALRDILDDDSAEQRARWNDRINAAYAALAKAEGQPHE